MSVVGLVFVCHSAKLAQGVAELAAQMGAASLRIGAAGGLDQPGSPLGTDAFKVVRAIDEVWSQDGVLVLMDLGSAVLSAELALDMLPDERRGHVLLTEAPLVEGAVAAAVAASLGEPLAKVAEEARGALAAKAAHLGRRAATEEQSAAARRAEPQGQALELRLTVNNPLGLHARPAALVVRTVASFDAQVSVANASKGLGPASARSLNAIAALQAGRGDEIVVRAAGREANEALRAIQRLADANFGDPPGANQTTGATVADARRAAQMARGVPPPGGGELKPPLLPLAPGTLLTGLPASPGVAVGEAHRLVPLPSAPSHRAAGEAGGEWVALQRALAATAADIRRARGSVARRVGEYEAAIFDAHLLFLEDEALLGPVHAAIFEGRQSAADAWAATVADAVSAWEAVDDPYLRARAADLRAVGDQVLGHLLPAPVDLGQMAGVVVAPDVSPAQVAAFDRQRVRALACAFGGPTSHAAILARSLGIPAVVGVGSSLLGVAEGTVLVVDGEAGTVLVQPAADAVRAAKMRRARRAREDAAALGHAQQPAVTGDGRVVRVEANVARLQEIDDALAAGADGVGLLRTELLFLEADRLPSEEEQEQMYRAAAEALGGRPLTVRTLDVGADKQLPYLPMEPEQNPSLGVRGIRLALARPELLATQLRAALRVAADHPLRLLLPMVTTVDELLRVRQILGEARAALTSRGVPAPEHLELGIMVEVPAACLLAEAFVPYVDFFSLGTNDLAQYAMAADRGNSGVGSMADALHPAVLRLVDHAARAAAAAGRKVGVCGELGGDPLAVPLLLGLGATELSMTPARIAAAKQAVRGTHLGAARRLAKTALAAASAADVRRLCASHAPRSTSG